MSYFDRRAQMIRDRAFYVVKHGDHDQEDHGNRGGGGDKLPPGAPGPEPMRRGQDDGKPGLKASQMVGQAKQILQEWVEEGRSGPGGYRDEDAMPGYHATRDLVYETMNTANGDFNGLPESEKEKILDKVMADYDGPRES